MSIQQRELAPGHLLVGQSRNTGKEWIAVAGETLIAGQIVCCSGVNEAHVQVLKAASDVATKRQPPLFMAMHGASAGDQVRVTEFNVLTNVNTSGGGVGAPIFLTEAALAGGWTRTAPATAVQVGVILVVDASAGSVLFSGTRG